MQVGCWREVGEVLVAPLLFPEPPAPQGPALYPGTGSDRSSMNPIFPRYQQQIERQPGSPVLPLYQQKIERSPRIPILLASKQAIERPLVSPTFFRYQQQNFQHLPKSGDQRWYLFTFLAPLYICGFIDFPYRRYSTGVIEITTNSS